MMIKCYLRRLMADYKVDDISDLIRLSGISRTSINKLYKETMIETIKLETLFKLCDTFHCKLSDLIEYAPDEPDSTQKKGA